jgi:hypothetical protein
MKFSAYYGVFLTAFVSFFGSQAAAEVWRLAEAAGLPEWASLTGSFRVRYENLEGQYRAGRTGSDQILVMRSLLHGTLRGAGFRVGAELQDSRQELADSGTPLSASIVNSAELLQAYVAWQGVGPLDSKSTLTLGRQTLDLGKRRLVARNRFRNTLNAFTGADWQLAFAAGQQLRVFFVLPVQRLPSDVASLLDNEARFDDEDGDVRLWGVFASTPAAPWGDPMEVYVLGLNEDDSSERATRNRDIYTLGTRLFRQAAPGRFDYEIESMIQWGESRSSTSSTIDLDHLAHFQHAELGYSFDRSWRPRLVLQFDYASGDDDPADRDNNRFDTLFGARRFDFGPTSIYGPFARSNLVTPGVRVQFKPAAGLSAFIAYRAYWLASDRDAWTTARVSDPSGGSGSFLGQQVEGRLRWDPFAGNVRVEIGAAYLAEGDFSDDVPNANPEDDSLYVYVQTAFTF